AVDLDGGCADGSQGPHDLFDRCAGGVLEIAADGQRCEHHGDVRFDRLALAMENRPGTQVALSHPEGCLYLPEIVVSGDDAGSVGTAAPLGDSWGVRPRGSRPGS